MSFFDNPEVRLFLRAALVAAMTFATKFLVIDPTTHTISYSSAALSAALVSAVYAFASIFTPLNKTVGLFKDVSGLADVAQLPTPIEPPGDTTEVAAA